MQKLLFRSIREHAAAFSGGEYTSEELTFTGSYTQPFIVLLSLSLMALVLNLLIKKP